MPSNEKGKKSRWFLYVILGAAILLPYAGLFAGKGWFDRQLKRIDNASFVLVDKQDMCLHVYDYRGKELMTCPVTTGMNYGNKITAGDFKTPEGVFLVEDIQDASAWEHDFGDGLGPVSGSYGPWFIRLNTPGHKGIGIHGTHKPETLGYRDSEGCIRLDNPDVERLKSLVAPGTVVIVRPGQGDVVADLMAAGRLDSLIRVVDRAAGDIRARKNPGRPAPDSRAPETVTETRTGRRIH